MLGGGRRLSGMISPYLKRGDIVTQCTDRHLGQQDVLALAEGAGIRLAREDLASVTAELNGLIDGLAPLAAYWEGLPCEGERDLRG